MAIHCISAYAAITGICYSLVLISDSYIRARDRPSDHYQKIGHYLAIDFLFFITARMYFHCHTYFPMMISMCMCSLVFQDGTCNTIPRALYKYQEVFGKLCC